MSFQLDPTKDKWLENNKLRTLPPANPSKTDADVPVFITWFNALGADTLNSLILFGVRQGMEEDHTYHILEHEDMGMMYRLHVEPRV